MIDKQKVINHWKRMIKWAKTQPKKEAANKWRMFNHIQEHWEGTYCAWCIRHDGMCFKCSLGKKFGACDNNMNLWRMVYQSKTWEMWIKYAERFLIERIRKV